MPKQWRLFGLSDTFVIARRTDMRPGSGAPVNPTLITSHIDRWLGDPHMRTVLLDIYGSVCGHSADVARRGGDANAMGLLRTQLLDAFHRGELVALRTSYVSMVSYTRKKAEPKSAQESGGQDSAPAQQESSAETTWVEIEVLDEQGEPAQGVKYRIEIPGGTVRSGTLDAHGKARIEGINHGLCSLWFPDLHAADWDPA